MSRTDHLLVLEGKSASCPGTAPDSPADLQGIFASLGIDRRSPDRLLATLPFGAGDVTAGAENELQAVVLGKREDVDLPLTIEGSDYFANILKRARAGDTPEKLLTCLEDFLAANTDNVWENSWVRFPRRVLGAYAEDVFRRDLLADKGDPGKGLRSDANRFVFRTGKGEEFIRLPVSYLVKLALAEAFGSRSALPGPVRVTAARLMDHYLNDNTSPETFSFHIVPLEPATGMGKALARETAKRFLLTQLLTMYANERFALRENGQQAMIYFAPQPPLRQKELNDLIPDAFYRELFMSPCLSGWNWGEEKFKYMQLCHQVLGRSQLNAVAKLREAGIILNNLVVLPNVSNTSLANNGTHISLGSRILGARLAAADSRFAGPQEKYLGDLAVKIAEHFLPLFAGTYSAAPFRLGFTDFHPEKALGFLPHQLDYTHLRMLWRRWRKKARLSLLGHSLTPFGPLWLDKGLGALFGLKGDFVPDFRLLDYPVCLLSTPQSPALDGRPGNQEKLKGDLADMGIFDRQMSLYLFFKSREFALMGFSGMEGRHYSLFEGMETDLGNAAGLQVLITALAYKYLAEGSISHRDIPDDPSTESERRQIFFGTAIGLPTFFVRRKTGNRFLLRVLQRTAGVRSSRRYAGYWRVGNLEYRRALWQVLAEDGADLAASFGLGPMLEDLRLRLEAPEKYSAAGKLTRGILDELGVSSPMEAGAGDFNRAAERYYRNRLRKKHLAEGFSFLEKDLLALDGEACVGDQGVREALNFILSGKTIAGFLRAIREDLLAGKLPEELLLELINLTLLSIHRDSLEAEGPKPKGCAENETSPSIHRAI
jgi:hypothetical protein